MVKQFKKAIRDMLWFFVGLLILAIIAVGLFIVGDSILSMIKHIPQSFLKIIAFFKEYWISVVAFLAFSLITAFLSTLLENTRVFQKPIKWFKKIWNTEENE